MKITLNQEGNGELYLKIMKAICGDVEGKSMCDLGCHKAPYTPQLGFAERTYVDIQKRPMDFKPEQKKFVKEDMVEFLKRGKTFDVTISSDSLEHLEKRKGMSLIYLMEKYSGKQIIFTPLGEHDLKDDKNPDSHRSGWYPEYFEGWASIVLPNFHPSLGEHGVGAFFVWHCDDIQKDFDRVNAELLNHIGASQEFIKTNA